MSELLGDYSQLYTPGDHYYENAEFAPAMGRNPLGNLLGFSSATAYEDYEMQETSANNALYRDLLKMDEQNMFNAREAQKNRDFQERLSNTAYQRAVKDMKLAGINPAMLYQSGGASVPSGSFATSGSGESSRGSNAPNSKNDMSGIVSLLSGIIKLLA